MKRTERTIGAIPDGRRSRATTVAVVAVAAILLAACSSTASGSGTGSGSKGTIPSAAFSDHTGITATTVHLGNVSTKTGGLFAGAPVGAEAYAAYVNSTGGINGRKLVIDSSDDGYGNGANNKAQTQADVSKDFAMVGSFSLNDAYGGAVLAANPSVPNVTVSLDQATNNLPNTFSPQPAAGGWAEGPLLYFKKLFPNDVLHAGALVADQASAIQKWNGEKAAMQHLGYNVIYSPTFAITQTDFTQNVVAMRNAGVKILFIEQMPENYAAAVIKALNQQDFHPEVVLGASTYSDKLVSDAGGASATDGIYLEQSASLYLGEDASAIPGITTFQTWVQKSDPGWAPDLYTLYGWTSAELFAQALTKAGKNPSRGSVLQALRSVTSYSADNVLAPVNPAAKAPANCYIIAHVVAGKFQRLDDPPLDSATHGYRCDAPYYFPPGTKPTT